MHLLQSFRGFMFCFVFQFCVLKDGRAGEIAQCVRALAPQMWGPEFKSQTPTTIQAQLPVPVTLELGSDYRQIQALARQNGELLVQWYEWEEWNWGWAVDFMSKGFTQAKECKFHSRNHLMKKKRKSDMVAVLIIPEMGGCCEIILLHTVKVCPLELV